jgi:hypothetical protein
MTTESQPLAIQTGFVYENETGEQRLVVSVDHGRANPVAVWRTPDPRLPKGAKAQGSATVASFRRWAAAQMRKATVEDWSAFQEVERRRVWNTRDTRAIREIKRSQVQS